MRVENDQSNREIDHTARKIGQVLRQTVVAVDFDGTLASLVDNRDEALPDVFAAERISDFHDDFLILTGRPITYIDAAFEKVLGAKFSHDMRKINVCGQHGMEWRINGEHVVKDLTPKETTYLNHARQELSQLAERFEQDYGLPLSRFYEDKPFSVCMHWRGVDRDVSPQARAAIHEQCNDAVKKLAKNSPNLGFQVLVGHDTAELRHSMASKGQALSRIMTATHFSVRKRIVLFGDDMAGTDGDAARYVKESCKHNTVISVGNRSEGEDLPPELIDVYLAGPMEVGRFLQVMCDAALASSGMLKKNADERRRS